MTWLVAFGSNLSALWILNANGWMQYPTGAHFDIDTLRMEMTSFSELVFNPVSQVKFVHTVMAGYVTGAMFIMAISAWYLLRGRGAMSHYARLPSVPSSVLWRLSVRCNSETVLRMKSRKYNR